LKMMLSRCLAARSCTLSLRRVVPVAARTYSTPSAEETVLANLRGVPGRYTRVLLEQSHEAGVQDEVRRDLEELSETMKKDLLFRTNLNTLDLSHLPVHTITRVFLDELRKNKHTRHLHNIAKSYEDAMRQVNDEVHVTVTTANELSDAEFEDLYAALSESYAGDGGDLVLETKVAPSILGGVIINTEESMLDLSVQSMVKKWADGTRAEVVAHFDGELMDLMKEMQASSGKRGNAEFSKRVEDGVKVLEKQLGW